MFIRELHTSELHTSLLRSFHHHQTWGRTWVRGDTDWVLKAKCGVRQWDNAKRQWIVPYLKQQINRGGCVLGAFDGNRLVGFASVDGLLRGADNAHANMTMLFVDDEYQHQGIGKALFTAIAGKASEFGAEKLFISAIPSEDTISFYLSVGCQDASEIIEDFVDSPDDRYLEFSI